MKPSRSLTTLLAAVSAVVADPVQGVSKAVYDRIFHFLRISMSIYAGDNCTLPHQPVVTKIFEATNDINGRIYHDDFRRQIILGFRGTASNANHLLNINWTLAPFDSNPACVGCKVHGGYYKGWLSVKDQVEEKVRDAVAAYPGYRLIVTGHSLGASMAAIASAQLVLWYPHLKVYTYGEPRSGDGTFAAWMDSKFHATKASTTRYFRTTHANDGIANKPDAFLGFVHQGFEFWLKNLTMPCSPADTWQCGGEQLNCVEGQVGDPTTPHSVYCGIASGDCPAPGTFGRVRRWWG